jgi:hypothetical protein
MPNVTTLTTLSRKTFFFFFSYAILILSLPLFTADTNLLIMEIVQIIL